MKVWIKHEVTIPAHGLNAYGVAKRVVEILDILKERDHDVEYRLSNDYFNNKAITGITFMWKTQEEL